MAGLIQDVILGGVIFIEVRDRHGITQIVFEPDFSEEAHNLAKDLRSEFVISIEGVVRKRPPKLTILNCQPVILM